MADTLKLESSLLEPYEVLSGLEGEGDLMQTLELFPLSRENGIL